MLKLITVQLETETKPVAGGAGVGAIVEDSLGRVKPQCKEERNENMKVLAESNWKQIWKMQHTKSKDTMAMVWR